MKRCPECKKDYFDDSLSYCLDDGAVLVQGVIGNESVTALWGSAGPSASDPSRERDTTAGLASSGNSIAILPFANISADPDNEYFCDGLAEEILNALAKIRSLKVAARTSAFSFRGRNVDIGRIARELGVRHVLEGSVRRSGDRLRITAQLIDAADGYHIWSERYDRAMRDIFDIQDEITTSIVAALKVQLLSGERDVIVKRHTDDPQAFEFYLKGTYYRWKLDPEEFRKCSEYFQRAIEIDPGFPLAYFGLASYYGYGTAFGLLMMPPEEGWQKAEAAMKKVAELDPTLPEVLIESAMQLVHYRRWKEAGAAIEEAAAANPSFSEIHHLNSSYLLFCGRMEEAIKEAKFTLTLDPLSVNYQRFLGMCLQFAGRVDEAIERYKSALELAPKDPSLLEMMMGAYVQAGEVENAAASLRECLILKHDDELLARFDSEVAGGFHDAAATVASVQIERMNDARSNGQFVLAIAYVRAYLMANDLDNALLWAERASEERNVFPLLFGVDPAYDRLRREPAFQRILQDIGIPRRTVE